MKILFVASVFRHFTSFHIPYLKYFLNKGYEVYVIANKEDQNDKKILESLGIKCLEVPISRQPLKLSNIKALIKLRKYSRLYNFDLIHVHTPMASFLVRMVFSKEKILYTAHGFHFYKGAPLLNWVVYYWIERILKYRTGFLFIINEEDYFNAINLLKYNKDKVKLVHGVGLELGYEIMDEFEKMKLKNEIGIHSEDFTLTYVAELNGNKNHMMLLKEWKEMNFKYPNLKFLIVGTGRERENLKKYIQRENLENIIFLGYRRDIMNLYQISDVCLLLSKREGLGKCLLEGMEIGLPCVATNTRGPKTLIKNNGFLIDLNQPENLLKCIGELIEDKALYNKMSIESKKNVKQYYIENVLPEYTEVYTSILEKSR